MIATAPWAMVTAMVASPVKLAVWLGNRVVAGTSLVVIWQRLKAAPNRLRRFLPWLLIINVVSIGLFVLTLRLLHR